MARPSKYSPEVRERVVRLVQEHTRRARVAVGGDRGRRRRRSGCTTETLRRWVRQAERDAGQRAGPDHRRARSA